MCNDINVRLFKVAKSNYNDAKALDALRTALSRAGCTVLTEAEKVIRDQLGMMVENSADFNDLLDRLNAAGLSFLTSQFVPPNAEERAERERGRARWRLEMDYREDIEEIASNIRAEIEGGHIEDLEGLDTYIHEYVDGCQRVIYTQQAKEACIFSDNDDAWEDCYEPRGSIDWSAMAYWVVRADVQEALGDLVHDEDEFDALRFSEGFTRTLGDLVEVVDLDLADDEDKEDEATIRLHNGEWIIVERDNLSIDQDDALILARDYDAP